MRVTRVAGDHELADGERQRRYTLALPDALPPDSVTVETPEGVEYAWDGDLWVTVHEDAGLARVRLRAGGHSTLLHLPSPSFDDALDAALDGDVDAARTLLGEFAGAVPAVFACGPFLDVDGAVALVDALASASSNAADDLHAARYDLVRTAATTDAWLRVDAADEFGALADGLDAVGEIGDVDVLDALGDAIAVAHDSVGETHDFLDDLGFDLSALADREDGRFFASYLAQVARTAGVHDAKQQAARRASATDHPDFDAATDAAERADYWERGAAWRDAVLPAAERSVDAFAYVLANALYWTGEVARSDSRADELCYEGAAAAAATIDLDWVAGRAAYERHRAAAHRHRSARNHALALSHFDAARATAEAYSALDPWEPTYSAAIVRSNQLSTAGDYEAAVAVLDDALDELRDQDVPDGRFGEMRDHLVGQRHERQAKLADGDDDRLAHLEAALDHYEAVGFDRSVDRIRDKLARAADEAGGSGGEESSGDREDALGPKPLLRLDDERGPNLEDIPSLHDSLTGSDPTAVGSPDPGVLPDEQADEFADGPRGPRDPRSERGPGPR
ncbi:MAG: hypothetical protein ABEH83_07610 [Halobacterium sp.]